MPFLSLDEENKYRAKLVRQLAKLKEIRDADMMPEMRKLVANRKKEITDELEKLSKGIA